MQLKKSLKLKMLVSIGGLAFLAFALTIGVVTIKAGNLARDAAVDQAQETAYRYSHVVSRDLNEAMDAARTLAHTFEGLKQSGQMPDRAVLNRILKNVLEKNPSFLAVWTVWEPNALDGNDQAWANTEAHDATGRFVPYWAKGANGISLTALAGYDQVGDGDFYQIPKRTGKETLVEPYVYTIDGQDVLMTTLSIPVRYQGKVVGVVGTDLTLDFIRNEFNGVNIFDGSGYLSVISNSGNYVSHPKVERLGKPILDTDPWASPFLDHIRDGSGFTATNFSKTLDEEVLRTLKPMKVGKSDTPWGVMVNVPMSAVLAGAKTIEYLCIGIGVCAVLLLLALIYFIVNRITGMVNQSMDFAQVMAEGDLSRQVTVKSQDEVGRLMGALNQISTDLGGVVKGLSLDVNTLTDASRELAGVSEQMSQGADETSQTSESVATAAEEMSSGMTSVAAAMEQAVGNVTMVAGAAEEMTATIQEVSKNTNTARSIADKAAEEANSAFDQIKELGDSAREIGNVTDTITDISEQTNLLALNATIEAARAGEAGKGFAVVAMEIKELARLTSQSTESIRSKIAGIQSATTVSVEAIQSVARIIAEMNEISSGVAAAVEEQAVTTQEIAANVTQVSQGLNQISDNIAHSSTASAEISSDISRVSLQAGEIQSGSTLVKAKSGELLGLSEKLGEIIRKFTV